MNTKMLNDFLRLLIVECKDNLDDELVENLREKVIFTASENNHNFVRQSDLFAMLELSYKIPNFEKIFKDTMYNTMFAELIIYLNNNSIVKDELEIKFNNNELSKQDIQKAQLLLDWTTKKTKELESTIEIVIKGEQFINKITYDLITDFYVNTLNKFILPRMKWQIFGLKLIIDKKIEIK